jgi:EGF domain-specific O-GlcNAc transferase
MLYSGRKPRQVVAAYILGAAVITSISIWYWNLSRDEPFSFPTWRPECSPPPERPTVTPETLPPLEFPTDYDLSADQQMCERMYGRGYFTHIDNHQHPYCESSSSSFVQCFSAPRLPYPWHSEWSHEAGDPLCIVRGVTFDASNDGKHFKAHCNARDFLLESQTMSTTGQTNPIDPSTDLAGVPNLADLAVYWGGSGPGGEFQAHWDFQTAVPGCSKDSNNGEWLFVIKREDTPNIWHKLMNIWQAMITLDAVQIARDPATGKPWMSKEDVANMQIVFDDDHPAEEIDDWYRMLNGKPPIRIKDLTTGTCHGNVLVPLAGSSSPFWAALLETVQHEPCRTSFLVDAFRRRVFRHLGLEPDGPGAAPNEHPSVTFVNRTHNRRLFDADRLLAGVRAAHPGSRVRSVDLAELPLREQVALAAATDVFVGHHGAGMMHLLFLPADAAVVEVTSGRARKFRSVSRLRGLAHFEADCLQEPEYAHAVNGTALPEGWQHGNDDEHWQSREFAYLLEDEFLGVVDAAVRNQRNRRYM